MPHLNIFSKFSPVKLFKSPCTFKEIFKIVYRSIKKFY